MANSFRNELYRSPKTYCYIAAGLLGSLILCSILFILFGFGLALYPDSVTTLANGSKKIPVAYLLIGIFELLRLPLFVATVVFFLIWEYRTFNNLSVLKAQNLEFSPGWAVGWWFIPFANLVKPFQAMRELWCESDPDYDADLGFLSGSASAPTIMGFWWGLWLLSNFSSFFANKLDGSAYFPTALIIASIFQIAAAGLLIIIMLSINRRQEGRFQSLGVL